MIKAIFSVTFVILISLPLTLLVTNPKSPKLGGVENTKRYIVPTFDNFYKGSLQAYLEKRFARKSGIFPYLVRSNNQINFSIFRHIFSSYRNSNLMGRENSILGKNFMKSANGYGAAKRSRMERVMLQLKKAQDYLKSRGVLLIYLMSTNKPVIHPELVPAAFKLRPSIDRQTGYELAKEYLDKYEINYIDGHQFFLEQRRSSSTPAFAYSGSHWNQYGACLITKELIKRMEAGLGKKLRSFGCDPVVMRPKPVKADLDRTRAANLWLPSLTYRPDPEPSNQTIASGNEYQPNVLFEGTSFLWSVLTFLSKHQIYSRKDFLFYFTSRSYVPASRPTVLLTKAPLDWEKEVFSKDVIILEANQAFPHKVGHGFLKEMLKVIGQKQKDSTNQEEFACLKQGNP